MKLIDSNCAVESRNYTAPTVDGLLQNTVQVAPDHFGGAHLYRIQNFTKRDEQGSWVESETSQTIQFLNRLPDGTTVEGVIDVQVIDVLIDRLVKMNGRFPDPQNNLALAHLYSARACFEQRSKERLENGKLGKNVK